MSSTRPELCFYMAALHLLIFSSVARDMRTRKEVAALRRPALKVTPGTWGYWREPEGKSRGTWQAWKSMIRASLWQVAEKGKPFPMKMLNVHRLLGTEITKSRWVPAAAGVTGDLKTVKQQDPLLTSQTITIKATQIAAQVHEPPKRFLEINKILIVINGDRFGHLDPEGICPAWLYEEMVRADTLICGSQTVVDAKTERGLSDDFNAPRMGNMLRTPIFSWRTKPKATGDATLFDVTWLLISSPDSWMRKV